MGNTNTNGGSERVMFKVAQRKRPRLKITDIYIFLLNFLPVQA